MKEVSGRSDPQPPNLGGLSYRIRGRKSGRSDPQPPNLGGLSNRIRGQKSDGSDPQPPNLGGEGADGIRGVYFTVRLNRRRSLSRDELPTIMVNVPGSTPYFICAS